MSALSQAMPLHLANTGTGDLRLCCPQCGTQVCIVREDSEVAPLRTNCPHCGLPIALQDGIWRTMHPTESARLAGTVSAYETVRTAEGRWSADSGFYLALPWHDTTSRFAAQWQIRGSSFSFLQAKILPVLQKRLGKSSLRILDLGAGNCWMSYRLALAGHRPLAIDLCTNAQDGLGAARHYENALGRLFPRFEASMDRLPFADAQFDLAIYNASFHYSQDYAATVREALRVLVPSGFILIVDSPTYPTEADGEAMLREKSAEFMRRFGTDSGNMGGLEFLTPERLAKLEVLGIRWQRFSPWYGIRWALRPMIAKLRGRRRPSAFFIYLGTPALQREASR